MSPVSEVLNVLVQGQKQSGHAACRLSEVVHFLECPLMDV